jgi:hypothetical protein
MIGLILIVDNLKSIYYLNKTYNNGFYGDSVEQEKVSNEIDDNIKRIKKDQGIYNDEEYKKILAFINLLENYLKEQNNFYYFYKKHYTYSDIVEFYNCHQNFIYLENQVGIFKKYMKYYYRITMTQN